MIASLQNQQKVLFLLIFFFNPFLSSEAQDCSETAMTSAGHQIIFNGVTYNTEGNSCTSTWSYCLIAGPAGNPEISHFMIANDACLECFDSEDDIIDSSHPFEIGVNPTTNHCGIKYDFGLNYNEELCFSFTLDGAFEVSQSIFVAKAGNGFTTVEICGPGNCTNVSCEEETTVDCTDITAIRQVENTADNCGTWCDGAYVFTLGPGNCYVAGDDLIFTEYTNGTALLSGSVIQGTNIGQLSVTFTGRTNIAPEGSPKYMLCIDNGGDFWYYYSSFTGTFTYADGHTKVISQRGPAFQVGYGANVQDTEYGASGWFDTDDGDVGDMNFQLSSPIECIADEIALESECAEVGDLFETLTDNEASNGTYLSVIPGNNSLDTAPEGNSDRIRFTITTTKSGAYNIFARVKAPGGSDDSFWVRVNGGTWVKWNNIEQSNLFIWDQVHDNNNGNTPVAFYFNEGTNTIDFAYREDGAAIDKIFISQNQGSPQGLGAEAEACGNTGGNLDCLDIIAVRQVENTADNCGSWCSGAYVFTLGPGNCYVAGDDLVFTEYTDGTALLSGSVIQGTNIGQLSVTFTGRTTEAPEGSPKYMLCVHDGAEHWYYYTAFSGTFIYPNGTSTSIIRRGPSFQVGYGANVQDFEFGASGWFDTSDGEIGDLNFQLSNPIECTGDEIFLEIECAEVGNIFETHSDTNASNGDYLSVIPGNNSLGTAPSGSQDRIRFNVSVSQAGPYHIFARVQAGSSNDDSFWVRANNGEWVRWNQIEQSNTFIWDQVHDNTNDNIPVTFFLEAGENTIDFAYREDGTNIDKIYIALSDEVPTGLGAEAENCECYEIIDINCVAVNDICGSVDSLGINLEISGTSSSFDILWSNGATTQNLTNLEPGTYSVTVTADDGCSASCETTLEFYEPFSIECNATPATCNQNGGSNNDGTVTVTATGGTAPYTYHWSNNACTDYEDNLEEGTYTITVTDANGCEEVCTVEVITELPIYIGCFPLNSTCDGNENAAIVLEVSVDPNLLTYEWSNGATTQHLSDVGPGTYSVTVTSTISGCTKSCEATIEPLSPLSITCEGTDITCGEESNGTITVTATGGTAPYTYHWSNNTCTDYDDGLSEGTYTITVTDANGCEEVCSVEIQNNGSLSLSCSVNDNVCDENASAVISTQVSGGTGNYTYVWSNGATSAMLENVAPGIYSLTVTDQEGCSAICETEVIPISTIQLSCSASNTSCDVGNDGTASANVSGGTAPFIFLWNNGANTQEISNLSPGTYSVLVTDANGCEATCSVDVIGEEAISVNCNVIENVCDGNMSAAITTQITGGSGNFIYSWSNGANTPNLENLGPGIYSLTVTDQNGCFATCQATITQVETLNISCSAIDVSCEGANDGTANVIVSGGTAPFTYIWSNGANNADISGLTAGNYSLLVIDANNCEASCNVTINETPGITLICDAQNASCDPNSTNSINVTVQGGTGNYTYEWSNGATTQNLENIAPGTYSLTVTDDNGCQAICESVIDNISAFTATCNASDLVCGEELTGNISVDINGGLAPFSYQWSNGATSTELSNIDAGPYAVTITDANGCTASCEAIVEIPDPIIVISTSTPLDCYGDSTSVADFVIEGGVGPYTYIWDNGSTEPVIEGLPAGFHGVTVTDANGCIGICGTWVESPELIQVEFTNTNVTCFGGSDGSINTTVSGGTGVYTFEWNNGQTTQNLNGLATGEYTLTVSDENGCTNIFTTSIESNAEITATCTSTPLSCHQDNSGSILLNVSGGSGIYTFAWSNGASTQHLENLGSGNYSVTVTDGNGCTATCTTFVEEPTALSVFCSANDLICAQDATGRIDVNIEGGNAPYTFQWSNGATSQNLDNLSTGAYTLTVTDANNCTAVCSANVETAAPLIAICNAQDLFCGEANTGILTVDISGGTAPFTYLWSNGATSQNLDGLSAGFYEVTVSDANGCTSVCNNTINVVPVLSASCSGQGLLCGEANSGLVNLTVSGGTAPFTYLWSNGNTTQDLINVAAGNYSVTVTDSKGCVAVCNSTITFIEPIMAVCNAQDLECAQSGTGSIDLNVSGGTLPYTFLWSNGSITEDLTNLDAGDYTVTITDANGCTSTCTSTVNADPMLAVVCNVDGATCGNSNSGNINIDVSGGVAPYTFLWSNGSTTEDLINISSGNYVVTVTDVNGCIASCSAIVEVSLGLNLSCQAEGTQCGEANTGSIDLIVSGGTGNYTFAWSNGATTEDILNLDAGTYAVTVTDTNGCTGTCVSTVEESTELEAVCDATEIPCGGQPDGSIDLTVTGGTGEYTYEWSNGETTEDITGVTAGTYSVTVSDSNGCTTTCSTTVTEAPGLQLSCVNNNISCRNANDGSIDANVSGGTAPYTYVWSNGASTEDLNNLAPGAYTLTVTDANGCSMTCSSLITQPANLLLIASGNDITCFGDNDGTAFATVIGGTVPYVYTWSNGANTPFINNLSAGTYNLTVTDANGCQNITTVTINEPTELSATCTGFDENCQPNSGAIDLNVTGGTAPYNFIWSNGVDTEDLFSIPAGYYMVTITDANGCNTFCATTVEAGNPITLNGTATGANCGTPSVGSIDLTVSGGGMPYSYAWSNGAATEDLVNVPAGTYTVTVTDSFNCTASYTATVDEAPSISISLNPQNVDCNGAATGSIELTTGQGLAPFTYQWSNGANTSNINNLNAGSYQVTVTDANGCQGFASTTISQPSAMLVVVSSNPASCNGSADGNAFVTAIGGLAPYQYLWSTGAISPFINGLAAGTYTVTVTDTNGCTATSSAIVQEPNPINVDLNINQILCQDDNNGSIESIISGGEAPYSYAWSNGANSSTIGTLTAGTYILTVTDNNGCTASATASIASQNQIVISCTPEAVLCAGESNGAVNTVISGGLAPYSYTWSNGATEASISNLPAGQYGLTVTDANGCSATCSSIVTEPEQLIAIYGSIDANCFGADDGILEAYGQGGVLPYTYEWSTGDSTEVVGGLPAGAYGLTLTDANGCIFICGIIINEPQAITCSSEINPASSGNPDLSDLTIIAQGGTGTYEYSIDNGVSYQTSNVFADLSAGTYTVIISDENACTSSCDPITITGGAGLAPGTPQMITEMSPNPTTDQLNVSYESPEAGFTIFEIKDIAGNVMFSREVHTTNGINNIQLNTSRLISGTYVLTIYTEHGVETEQFVVMNSNR